MCNLFHSFDPYVSFGFLVPLKWLVVILVVYFMSWQVYFLNVGMDFYHKLVVKVVWDSFRSLMESVDKAFLFLLSLIIFACLVNILGLIPFVFTLTSHLSVNLSFSFSLWLSGVMMAVWKSMDSFLSHMVPMGTPIVLWVFLVLVESVSQMIRPFTLSIRLMANMMAGHLILSLLGGMVSSGFFFFPLIFLKGVLLVFECAVSVVQAYVFVSLLSLYWDES